jgi:hypothetical protein
VGLAEVADGPIYKVHRYKDHPAGAGEINMALEDAVRSINRANSAKSADMNVWDVSECIDEYFKPEPEAKISPRCGLSDDEWDMVIGRAPTLMEALDLANHRCIVRSSIARRIRSPPKKICYRDVTSNT